MARQLSRAEINKRRIKRRRARVFRRFLLLFIALTLTSLFLTGYISGRQKRIPDTGIPLLLQTDSRWSNVPYGSSTIGVSGCAPTCLSMAAIALTGNQALTPDVAAKFSEENGFYIEGTGTSWKLMTEGAKEFGIKVKELALDENLIKRELERRHPIICSVGPGDFTTEGHFIVLTSYENGGIYLNDPNSERNSSDVWSYERLAPQINAMWVYR